MNVDRRQRILENLHDRREGISAKGFGAHLRRFGARLRRFGARLMVFDASLMRLGADYEGLEGEGLYRAR